MDLQRYKKRINKRKAKSHIRFNLFFFTFLYNMKTICQTSENTKEHKKDITFLLKYSIAVSKKNIRYKTQKH